MRQLGLNCSHKDCSSSRGYVVPKESTVNFVPVESDEAAQQTSFKGQNALISNCFELKESISMMSAFQLQRRRSLLKAEPCLPLLHLFDVVLKLCGNEGKQITEDPLNLRFVECLAVTLCVTNRYKGERSWCC